MRVQSLAYRTDLIFPRFDGQVIDRGEYLVILTPNNPDYHWGNFLLLADPPVPGDFERWRTLFDQEIGHRSGIAHVALGWDSPAGDKGEVAPFLAADFELLESVVLTARQVVPAPRHNPEVVVRPVAGADDWRQVLDTQLACRPPEFGLVEYRRFKAAQIARYQQMSRAGLGHWFGAFLGGQLVGDLGLFVIEGVGRFQEVETHPDFRRRGVCSTLVYETATYAFQEMQAQTLVMVADEHYHAAAIYESIGFKPTEKQLGLSWWSRP